MRVYYYENELEDEFNAFDSFAIQLAFEQAKLKKKKMYRVIREGNYTGFPGFYGVLMRHCNTLPLSSNFKTMEDSDVLDDDGFYVQEYTVHFCEPIYPDPNKKRAQNSCEMRDKNYEAWK